MKIMFGVLAAAALTLSASGQGVIFDNGGPDGTQGLSVGEHSFGWRQVADDFVLGPDFDAWYVTDAHFSGVWYYSGGVGYITDVLVEFYEDTGAGPAMDPMAVSPGVVAVADQYYTGAQYFTRDEVAYDLDFDPVLLTSNTTYWVSLTPMACPENFFWLTSNAGQGNIFGQEAYAWMDDQGIPKWTSSFVPWGEYYDMSFQLTGYGVPAPGALALFGLAGLARRRRR